MQAVSDVPMPTARAGGGAEWERGDGQAAGVADCPVCGTTRFESAFEATLPWLKRCPDCRMQFASPQPDEAELATIYDEDYYRTFGYQKSDGAAYRQMQQARAERLLERAERQFPPGRLLDVGSGLGDLLAVAQRRGWEVQGVERNRFAVAQAERLVPGATFAGTLDEFQSRARAFDVVTCTDVLEHLRRPDEALERFHDWLRPGGALVVTTIDVSSLAARLMGPRWPHYHRDHLWYFTPGTLTRLAESAGFEIVCCRRAEKLFHLEYLLSILAQCGNFPMLRRLARTARRLLPQRVQHLRFSLREGLLLMARRG